MLYEEQEAHFEELLSMLQKYDIAIDASQTGTGKTFVTLALAKRLRLGIRIICPKTLIPNWKDLCENYEIQLISINTYSKFSEETSKCLFVCDEFHYLKNLNARNQKVSILIRKHLFQEKSKVLLLSATPFDKEECIPNIQRLISKSLKVRDIVSSMSLNIKPSIEVYNNFTPVPENSEKEYYKSLTKLAHSAFLTDDRNLPVNPGPFITKYMKKLHDSLIEILKLYISKYIETKKGKLIIVVRFIDHINRIYNFLKKEYGIDAGIISGFTTDRFKIVKKFQEPNLDLRILLVSIETGGVGISLDDQFGTFPRTIFMLPTFNSIELIQCLGRIFRRNTQSNSKVYVLYGQHEKNVIVKNMDRKGKILTDILGIHHTIPFPNNFTRFQELEQDKENRILISYGIKKKCKNSTIFDKNVTSSILDFLFNKF
jgi:superfamily II DNA or RNA helicase